MMPSTPSSRRANWSALSSYAFATRSRCSLVRSPSPPSLPALAVPACGGEEGGGGAARGGCCSAAASVSMAGMRSRRECERAMRAWIALTVSSWLKMRWVDDRVGWGDEDEGEARSATAPRSMKLPASDSPLAVPEWLAVSNGARPGCSCWR